MGNTKIEWTDHTLNPLVGCTKTRAKGAKDSGCDHCYAARASKSGRLQQFPQYHGVVDQDGSWTGQVNFVPEQLEKLFKFRKLTKVFMPSMSDPFHPAVKDEWLDQIFAAIALNPHITVQMLTKRPERMMKYVTKFQDWRTHLGYAGAWASEMANFACEKGWRKHQSFPDDDWNTDDCFDQLMAAISEGFLSNLWLGTSIENQKAADERIPALINTPAALRFLSCEPLLEPVQLNAITDEGWQPFPKTNWVIIGGESGSGARPFDLEWARSLIQECRDAGVPVFLKQLGSNPVGIPKLRSAKGGDIQEWPQNLRVREFPVFSAR
jgi:protein gp37